MRLRLRLGRRRLPPTVKSAAPSRSRRRASAPLFPYPSAPPVSRTTQALLLSSLLRTEGLGAWDAWAFPSRPDSKRRRTHVMFAFLPPAQCTSLGCSPCASPYPLLDSSLSLFSLLVHWMCHNFCQCSTFWALFPSSFQIPYLCILKCGCFYLFVLKRLDAQCRRLRKTQKRMKEEKNPLQSFT